LGVAEIGGEIDTLDSLNGIEFLEGILRVSFTENFEIVALGFGQF
jgi:hypothetical protein